VTEPGRDRHGLRHGVRPFAVLGGGAFRAAAYGPTGLDAPPLCDRPPVRTHRPVSVGAPGRLMRALPTDEVLALLAANRQVAW
jgi:hypothetical protein